MKNLTQDSASKCHAAVISATDYSPFGAPLPGRTYQASEYRFGFNGKEKDDETYDEGNAYDFGARIYDARLGRWLSVDPSQNKYPHLSPYNSFENNPIYFNDPDGKDAGYSISGNTITFSAQIYISGSGATAAKSREIQKQVSQTWGKDFKYTDANGKVYNVKFDIKVAVLDVSNKEQQSNFQKGSANIVSLVANPKEGFRDYVIDGNTGVWGQNSIAKTRGHETGHFLGLEDTYHDVYFPKTPLSNPIDEYGYNIASVNYSTTDPLDIMGTGSRNPKSSVQQSAIDAIANYALTNKNNVTQSDGKVTGRIDAGTAKLAGASSEVQANESQPKPSVIPKNKKH